MNDEQFGKLAAVLAGIERHMGVLAEYAEMLRVQSSGEKVYEVGSYVVSVTSNGDACVYLYATHPGLQYRVCTVYEERLGELPFALPKAYKTWDGEAAPSRDGALKKGYMIECQPFKVSLLPTGKTTEAGLPVHRFNRVLSAGAEPRGGGMESEPEPEAEREWAELPNAAASLPQQPPAKPEPGPKISQGAQPLPAGTGPAPRLPATLSGDAGPAFQAWAKGFAARHAAYQNKEGGADMYHILMTVASFGVRQVTMENIEEVKGKLESHAAVAKK